ncbi:glycosyltransferase family 87 protein [Aurantibacter aestuarii]|uniref:DUF2029 domain-containing protein n=1 Tax=Aurantibacter aestuarii TaxID=1266046 RepID=A0A2T1NDT9_9FLAO|nr:glycosyltransferase family 87 protein [Aurantibacter aestuarii]PSG90608.1 hypothetical protein C7H52_04815 [Aurantibacter aestuarii]
MKKTFKTNLVIKEYLIKLWIAVVLVIVVLKGILPGWNTTNSDFNNYYVASKLVLNKKPIHKFYNNQWFKKEAQELGIVSGAKFSPFPPITAYAYVPLAFFDVLTAKRIWLVINCIILLILPFRIRQITSWNFNSCLLFITLFCTPIASCINSGQIYFLLGFVLLEILAQKNVVSKPKLVGVLLGVMASLKYLPILFLAYSLKQKKRVVFFLFTLLSLLGIVVFLYLIDNQIYTTFFNHFKSHLQGDLSGQGKYAIGFQSLDSLLNNLFIFHSKDNLIPLINSPILKDVLKLMFYLLLFIPFLFIIRQNNYKLNNVEISIGLVGVFVVLPATASYHFLLLLLPLVYIFKWLLALKSTLQIVVISLFVFIAFNLQMHHIPNFKTAPIFNLLIHYPRLWSLLVLFLTLIYFYSKSINIKYG